MLRTNPLTLFDAQTAGASLSKTLWPGTYTVTLPTIGSGRVADLSSGSNVIGGVLAPRFDASDYLLDFAGVGAADQTLTVEIGKLHADGALAMPLASVALKSITTTGTVANVNPFTGAATAAVTWRLFDLATITAKGGLGQVLLNAGGTEDDTPCQLLLSTVEAVWYYVVVTSLGALTRALVVVTPRA